MTPRRSVHVWSNSNFDRKVRRSGKTLLLLLGHGLAAADGVGNGSRGFTASLLIVRWLTRLTVALAVGSARVTSLDPSFT